MMSDISFVCTSLQIRFRGLVDSSPELVEPILHFLTPDHSADSLHDVGHQLRLHVVADPLLLFLLKLDVEQLDKELDGGALQEDGEEDHGKAGGDEELAIPELNVENNDQGESDSPSETSVSHDELGLEVNFVSSPDVHNEGK